MYAKSRQMLWMILFAKQRDTDVAIKYVDTTGERQRWNELGDGDRHIYY